MKNLKSIDKNYETKRRWRLDNKDKCHKSDKEWRNNNKDRIKEYLKRNKDKINELQRKRQEKKRGYLIKKRELNEEGFQFKNFFNKMIYQRRGKYYRRDEEYKEKVRNGVIKFFKEHPEARKNLREYRLKQILPMKDTSIEIKIQKFLTQLQIEYFTHKYMHIEHGYQCDIFIPSIKTIIECDGDWWHGNPMLYQEEELMERQKKQRENDKIRTKELEEKGYKVIRLWEQDIKQMDMKCFISKISERREDD